MEQKYKMKQRSPCQKVLVCASGDCSSILSLVSLHVKASICSAQVHRMKRTIQQTQHSTTLEQYRVHFQAVVSSYAYAPRRHLQIAADGAISTGSTSILLSKDSAGGMLRSPATRFPQRLATGLQDQELLRLHRQAPA